MERRAYRQQQCAFGSSSFGQLHGPCHRLCVTRDHNSPEQIVIAGHAQAVARAMQLAKAAGAKRALLLPVSAPFHCPLMRPAQEKLKPALDAAVFQSMSCPFIN